jgi:hypothetical protein
MGSKKIQELRKECQDNLKEKFDYPKFHDAVLGSGSMPMTVLEKHIEWFIESQNQQLKVCLVLSLYRKEMSTTESPCNLSSLTMQ